MLLPKIKSPHRPIRWDDGRLWMGSVHYGLCYEVDDPSGLVWELSQRMTGTRTVEEIVAGTVRDGHGDPESVRGTVDFLLGSGSVEDAGAQLPINLNERDVERYSRSSNYYSWIDQTPRKSPYDLQSRLKDSSVTVLGVGGVGSAVAVSLAASGVGRIHCIDGDLVQLSNLNRQTLFDETDIGRPKVEAAVDRLRKINSDVDITYTHSMVDQADALEKAMSGADLFIHCADRPKDIELLSDEIAIKLNKPWILGCYAGPMLCMITLIPGQTACYACYVNGDRRRLEEMGQGRIKLERTQGFNPVIAPTAQLVGHSVALEALNLLLGLKVQTAGRGLHRNFLDYEHQYYVDAVAQPDCPHCGDRSAR